MVNEELTRKVVDFLNDLVQRDAAAVTQLLETRVPCNTAIQQHPTVQVTPEGTVGLLGLLNGLCGIHDSGGFEGHGPLTAFYRESAGQTKVEKFYLTTERPSADKAIPTAVKQDPLPGLLVEFYQLLDDTKNSILAGTTDNLRAVTLQNRCEILKAKFQDYQDSFDSNVSTSADET